jgi:hypothetical protein
MRQSSPKNQQRNKKLMSEMEQKAAENARSFTSTSRKFGSFSYDTNNNIVAIVGRDLKVDNLSEDGGEPYFVAWVDVVQDDGFSHNEAVENAIKRAKSTTEE